MKSIIIACALIITMGACASPKAEDDAIVCAKTAHGYERIPLWTDGIVRVDESLCK